MLEVKSFIFGPFATNTYVVSDNQGHVLLIDPACFYPYEQQVLNEYISNLQFQISNFKLLLVATHGHLDHLWGVSWACEQWHTPVLMHPQDIPMATAMQQQYDLFGIPATPQPFPIEPFDENSFQLSKLKFQLIPTPGHTPGSICLYNEQESMLFSGDTLFRDGYGRTDLPGGDMEQLIQSLKTLWKLPAGTLVYPGHGDTTIITRL